MSLFKYVIGVYWKPYKIAKDKATHRRAWIWIYERYVWSYHEKLNIFFCKSEILSK